MKYFTMHGGKIIILYRFKLFVKRRPQTDIEICEILPPQKSVIYSEPRLFMAASMI